MKRLFCGFLLLLAGCGYFNTMYNAQRSFGDAEKAAARGDLPAAHSAYRSSIEKASKHLLKQPNSRWRESARLIIARSRFALGEHDQAEQAFTELAAEPDARLQAIAAAYLGAIAGQRGQSEQALPLLNRALASHRLDERTAGIAYVARARVAVKSGDFDAAIADLANARGLSASELISIVSPLDPARLRSSLNHLAARRDWSRAARDSLVLYGATLRVAAGDTAGGIAEIERIAAAATGAFADEVRIKAAEWRLLAADSLADIAATRAILLPAIGTERARQLIQHIKTLEVLVERSSRTGQPLTLFAAGELARDELNAPRVATKLFVEYAGLAPQSVWAPKALLAASALADERTAARLRASAAAYHDNPYVAALTGTGSDDAFEKAEETLNRSLQATRAEALIEAVQRENAVGRAAAIIDSVRLAARSDSTRHACGILIDSLTISGIRADSVRAACLRHERERIPALLRIDTLLLRDSAKARLKRDTAIHQ